MGAGTGKATVAFASWGNPLLTFEPAPAMADVARKNLAPFGNVEVATTRFEDADIDANAFGLVACAQSWHWLDPETRIERFAEALYAHGTAAVMSNVQVTPDEHLDFFVRVQDVYKEHAPQIAHEGDFRTPDDLPGHPLSASDLFYDFVQFSHPWEWTLDAERYVGLMSTHSPHAALDEVTRGRLHEGIADLIEREFSGRVTESYVAVVALARAIK